MQVLVTLLRSRGSPLDRRDALAAQPRRGEFLIEYVTDERSGRPVKQAVLADVSQGIRRPILRPLRSPEILSAAHLGLVLRGTELADDGAEFVQEWWLRLPK